jgi:hypothetical protein
MHICSVFVEIWFCIYSDNLYPPVYVYILYMYINIHSRSPKATALTRELADEDWTSQVNAHPVAAAHVDVTYDLNFAGKKVCRYLCDCVKQSWIQKVVWRVFGQRMRCVLVCVWAWDRIIHSGQWIFLNFSCYRLPSVLWQRLREMGVFVACL